VAVVGCGDVSIAHFEAIEAIADAELVAVSDSDRPDSQWRRRGA
jgi:UDP-N-acetyl-2-amino-2-deoxyglucuronate dehydrogenase